MADTTANTTEDRALKKRVWGWMFFDWAQQPYATLGLTFIFAPYFSSVAEEYYLQQNMDVETAEQNATLLWSNSQVIAGLFIALTAPFLGAWAGATGRKLPWFYCLTVVSVVSSAALWFLLPDGNGLFLTLIAFWVGFVAAEAAFNLNNSILPTLSDVEKTGRISGSATAFGYWGGVISLVVMLLLFAEDDKGLTLLGNPPALGLDGEAREGTRLVGPFIAIWFAVFMIPYFVWVREPSVPKASRTTFKAAMARLRANISGVMKSRSCASFLLGSMFYRDALFGVYAFGGIYAEKVLEWNIIQIGTFGVVAAVSAAILSFVGALADQRFGPKPVIVTCCWLLILVSSIVVGMNRDALFGIPFPEGSSLPDTIMFVCGGVIGGAGGALYSASRSMMVLHCSEENATEAFGLFALTGKATTFLTPMLISLLTYLLSSFQLAFISVIFLFLLGLILLRWVQAEGDRAEWSETSSS